MKHEVPYGWTLVDGGREGDEGFAAQSNDGFRVIASWAGGWDHVSISRSNRTPTWEEMCRFKDLFFDPEEVVLQYHPPKSKYVNYHKHCLHLWRPQKEMIPMPPLIMV